MRPTAGLVSRGGVYGGWPSVAGSLGPMARTVTDVAKLLDVMVGYDPEDPVTARGVGHVPASYTAFLDRNGLQECVSASCASPWASIASPARRTSRRLAQFSTKLSLPCTPLAPTSLIRS